MTPVASMIGSIRIIRGAGIVHPVGNPGLDAKTEKALRRAIVEKALEALGTDLTEPRMFERPM
jgi:glycine reductase complex component B subunit gamma